jgi:hypothetical protein
MSQQDGIEAIVCILSTLIQQQIPFFFLLFETTLDLLHINKNLVSRRRQW